MKSANQIQRLIQVLSESSKSDYTEILNNFDFKSIDFSPCESWSSKKYTRNCIYRDAQFELLLLCWEEGQETSIHGHEGEDCWVYLLQGEMEEVFYTLDTDNYLIQNRAHKIHPDQQTFMNDSIGYHKLKNVANGCSLSLHLYAKPIESCSFYDEKSSQFVRKNLKYDTINEQILANKEA